MSRVVGLVRKSARLVLLAHSSHTYAKRIYSSSNRIKFGISWNFSPRIFLRQRIQGLKNCNLPKISKWEDGIPYGSKSSKTSESFKSHEPKSWARWSRRKEIALTACYQMSGWCWVVKQVAWQPGYGASAHEPGATSSTSEEHSLAQDRPCVVLYAWTRVSDLSARTWHPMSLNHADWPRRRHGERVPRCTPGLNHRRVAGSRANSETLRGNARKLESPRVCNSFRTIGG